MADKNSWKMTGTKPPEAERVDVKTAFGNVYKVSKKAYDRLVKADTPLEAGDVFRSYAFDLPKRERMDIWTAIRTDNGLFPIRLEYDDSGKIEINSVVIPRLYVNLCGDWHCGIGCLLYAVASTGNLQTGTMNRYGSDEAWYVNLFRELSIDVYDAAKLAKGLEPDYTALCQFEAWCDTVCEKLAESYGLKD